jgi:hypothetical protein
VSRLRDRAIRAAGTRGELTLYELDRATEIRCARCTGRSVTRAVAVPTVTGPRWGPGPAVRSCLTRPGELVITRSPRSASVHPIRIH